MVSLRVLPKGKLINKFNALGPYLRETQSRDDLFFFDCLAICVNIKPSPEKREFYGWWFELKLANNSFTYSYSYGVYNRQGEWQEKVFKDKKTQRVLEETLNRFFALLYKLIMEWNISLVPQQDFSGEALEVLY